MAIQNNYYKEGQGFFSTLGKKPIATVKTTPTPAPVIKTPTPTKIPTPTLNQGQSSASMNFKGNGTPPPTPAPVNKANSLFSGNIISKIFDAVRLPEYAIASFQKGQYDTREKLIQSKGKKVISPVEQIKTGNIGKFDPGYALDILKGGIQNVIPGVKARTSFSTAPGDFNPAERAYGVKNKTAQEVIDLGFTLGSPTPGVGAVAKIPGVSKVTDIVNKVSGAVSKVAKKTPALYKPVEVVNPYFRNPAAGKVIQESEDITRGRVNNLYKLLKKQTANLTPAEQARIGQILEGGITTVDKYTKTAKPILRLTEQIGKELVKNKLIRPETYEKYKGRYLSHIFTGQFDDVEGVFGSIKKAIPKVDRQFFKERKGAEGYIREFAAPVFKGLGTEIKGIETVKLYKKLASEFGEKVGKGKSITKEGFEYAGNAIKDKEIAKYFKNVALPREVIDYINKYTKVPANTKADQALNIWKAVKTIYNPAYHVRNVMSNQILSDFSTGKGIPRTILDYVKSVGNYAGKGDQRFSTAAEKIGLIRNPNFYESTKEFLQKGGNLDKKGMLRSAASAVGNVPRKVQSATEETAKLNVFRVFVEKEAAKLKIPIEKALKDKKILEFAKNKAEEAIFSPYRISPAERSMLGRLIPFYSFTRQALPFTVKTLAQNPGRVVKYGRATDQIESLSPEDAINPKQQPDKIKGLTRLPIKDKSGKNVYFDPTYILPYGNFDAGGFGSKGQLPFGLSLNPFLQFIYNIAQNRDPYFDQKIVDSNIPEERLKQVGTYTRRSFAPTFLNTIIDKLKPAFEGRQDYTGIERNKGQAILDAAGFKTKTYDSATLRSQGEKGNSAQLRSFQTEYDSIANDQSLTEPERNQKLQRLKEEYDKYLESIR